MRYEKRLYIKRIRSLITVVFGSLLLYCLCMAPHQSESLLQNVARLISRWVLILFGAFGFLLFEREGDGEEEEGVEGEGEGGVIV